MIGHVGRFLTRAHTAGFELTGRAGHGGAQLQEAEGVEKNEQLGGGRHSNAEVLNEL